jgi:O-antigen/teichoic acid export membrane protein
MDRLIKLYNHFSKDSLYRNSIYLMLSTAVMAFFGFFFWIINARLYSSEQVGIATSLFSVVSLISSFSLLGLNNAIVRYLPTSERKNQKINTSFTLVAAASALLALIYLIFISAFSPKLLFVRENLYFAAFFIVVIVFGSISAISDNVFVAYRSSKFILIKNTIFSLVKLALPVFLISLGAYGIFASVGVAGVVAFIFSLTILIIKFGYLIKPAVNSEVVKRMTKFSLGNYVAGFIGGLPQMVLPIIVLNNLGAKFSAYFYMDLMIASFLYVIPSATSQSLFAEGSYSERELKKHLVKAVKINFLLLVPAIVVTFFFGKYILLAFGRQYSKEGFILLQLFAVSGIFISVNYIFGSILRIKHKIKELVTISSIGAILILGLSYFLVSKGLLGIGIAFFTGQVLVSIILIILFLKSIKK